MLQDNERKYKEAQNKLNENAKRILEQVKKKKDEKKKGGYANRNIKIKDFNWKEMAKYSQVELEAKIDDIENEIMENKENFTVWKQQCHQWERKMRESGFT